MTIYYADFPTAAFALVVILNTKLGKTYTLLYYKNVITYLNPAYSVKD